MSQLSQRKLRGRKSCRKSFVSRSEVLQGFAVRQSLRLILPLSSAALTGNTAHMRKAIAVAFSRKCWKYSSARLPRRRDTRSVARGYHTSAGESVQFGTVTWQKYRGKRSAELAASARHCPFFGVELESVVNMRQPHEWAHATQPPPPWAILWGSAPAYSRNCLHRTFPCLCSCYFIALCAGANRPLSVSRNECSRIFDSLNVRQFRRSGETPHRTVGPSWRFPS